MHHTSLKIWTISEPVLFLDYYLFRSPGVQLQPSLTFNSLHKLPASFSNFLINITTLL